MRKIIILTSILVIAVAVMAVKYFSNLALQNDNVEKALKYIPQDAALILNFNNDDSFYEIFKEYELFGAVIGDERASEIEQLQQILLKQNDLKELTSDKNIFISFHPNEKDTVDFLYTINLNETIEPTDIEDALKANPELSVSRDSDSNIFTVNLKSLNKAFYVYFEKGAATGSFSLNLLQKSLNNDQPKIDQAFVREISNASLKNNNSPVNIFINHGRVPAFVNKYIRGKLSGNLGLLANIRGISALNMNYKTDALMFNGISKTDTADQSYVNLYRKQRPVKNELKKIFPANTACFILFGISNPGDFSRKLQQLFHKRKELSSLQNQIKLIQDKTGTNLEKELRPLLSDEFAVLETSLRERFAIIKLKNGRDANFTLQLISKPAAADVSLLNHSNIFYYYLGDPLKQFQRPYFSVVDNYLIIANASSVVRKVISDYKGTGFLLNTPDFAEYNQFVANQSNIFYFINNRNAEKLIRSTLKPKYASAFKNDTYGLKNFYGFSYQWSADDGHFFTNIYISYKGTTEHQLKQVWQTELGSALAITPQAVEYKGEKHLLLQDRSNNLHMLSASGRRVWSLSIDGKIQGAFQSIGGDEVIFCTSNRLFKAHLDGKLSEGFPIDLPFNVSGNAAILNNNKIYIPAGNAIMAYDRSGSPLPNWNHLLDGKILPDLQTLSIDNEHLVIAGTESGVFYIYDEIGDLVHKITDTLKTHYQNQIFLQKGKTLDDSKIVTSDTSGTITFVNMKGQLSKRKILDVRSPLAFSLINITGDESPEYIFLDKSGVSVFGKDEVLLWNYNFSSDGNRKAALFKVNNYTWQYGVTDSEDKELYLFKEDGHLAKGFPFKGGSFFQIAGLNSIANQYLITNKGSTVVGYKL